MRPMQCLRKSEHSFDGSVRISTHLERTQASRSSEPASYTPCRFHFIFRLTDFTGHLQDAEQLVDTAMAAKWEVDWLRDRSVASYVPVCVWFFGQTLSTVQCRATLCTA